MYTANSLGVKAVGETANVTARIESLTKTVRRSPPIASNLTVFWLASKNRNRVVDIDFYPHQSSQFFYKNLTFEKQLQCCFY